MNISTACIPKARELPEGFVYLDEWIEDCIIDAKYAGTDNFMGRPAAGYDRPLVVASRQVAEGCVKAANLLRPQGYILKVYDAFRPQRAVDDFCRWGEDEADQRRKPIHYPNIEKLKIFDEGYIARKSTHTRGTAVDLTLVDASTHLELDMGSIFDFMDVRSWPDYPGLTPTQRKNRDTLRDAMLSSGFEPLENEFWHYTITPEPYPDTYFDFPIR
ncbi:MAG: M15 family metallopeptidase [Oscillospiraceae bacterium]|nr:M15 family metallopeptidase [Oscillospiraceae bacterium]